MPFAAMSVGWEAAFSDRTPGKHGVSNAAVSALFIARLLGTGADVQCKSCFVRFLTSGETLPLYNPLYPASAA
jgi:hypothetical protein